MPSLTLIREKKSSTPLFKFKFGDTWIFATTNRSPVTWEGNVYIPEPAIDCKLPKQGINLDEGPCTITLPLERAVHPGILNMAQIIAMPRSCPDLDVDVINLLRASQDEMVAVYLYSGKMDKSRRNPSGKKSQVEIELLTELAKDLDNITLGRRCDPECDAIYGKALCGVDSSAYFSGSGPYFKQTKNAKVTVSFSSYRNSREIVVALHLPSHPGVSDQSPLLNQPINWWNRAILEADGVRIPVQEWRWDLSDPQNPTSTNIFILNRVPPLSWETPGKVFNLLLDCDRTPQACADRNNSDRFGGLGFGIPAYNPSLEVRDG